MAKSLILSGRSILLVTERLQLQPEDQHHWEELVATAQQLLVDTKKVRLPWSWLASWSLLEDILGYVVPTATPNCP